MDRDYETEQWLRVYGLSIDDLESDLYNALKEDDNYLDHILSIKDIDIIRSKGFNLSNQTLSSNLFIGLDKLNNQWYADCSSPKSISFYLIKPNGPGLMYSSRTFTRSEFEETF